MQAIQTKALPPTNSRGPRITAWCATKRIVLPRGDKALGRDDDHRDAAIVLIRQLRWYGHWVQGCLPNGDFAFVCAKRENGNTEGFDVWEESK